MGIPSPFLSSKDSPPLSGLAHSLAIESDTRLARSILSSAGAWACLLFFVSTLPVSRIARGEGEIPRSVLPGERDKPTVVIIPPDYQSFRKPIPKPKVAKQTSPPRSGGAANSAKPNQESGILNTKLVTSKTNKFGASAYEMINNVIKDLPKLDQVAVIRRDANSRFSGRKGKLNTDFNSGYDMKDGDGNLDMTGNLHSISRIEVDNPEMPKPRSSITEHSISQTQEEGWRSTASIWAVVKSHSPGLRHLYNQHLKMHPGLQGKVSVRFGIDPRGVVVSAEIEGTTTGEPRFDAAILHAVRSWRFEPVRHLGVEDVLVPLQFSE